MNKHKAYYTVESRLANKRDNFSVVMTGYSQTESKQLAKELKSQYSAYPPKYNKFIIRIVKHIELHKTVFTTKT
jgi:hypothetical protein